MINYPLRFKGAILEQNNQPLNVDTIIFKGPLQPGQVLVHLHYSGICGKQIEEIKGTSGKDPYLPHLLGHEGSGVVKDIGPGVTKVSPGDHVVLHWLKGSGIDAPPPLYQREDGTRINAGWITTFNEYAVVSENRVTKISTTVDLSIACLLGCAVTTGVGVVINEAKVRPGDSVAIFGCGGVGLCAIQGAALVNGYPIIAIDKHTEKLELASALGATHIINSSTTDFVQEIKKITMEKGVNVVIITATNQELIEKATLTTSLPGSVFVVNVPPPEMNITLRALDIHRRRTITGSYGGGCFPDDDIPRYLGLFERGHLKLNELISTIVSLERINDGINLLLEQKDKSCPARCVVKLAGV